MFVFSYDRIILQRIQDGLNVEGLNFKLSSGFGQRSHLGI